jgi:predicted amidohydrolase
MKICVAQTRPVKGDIRANIEIHKKMIIKAVSHGTDLIIFPELSLTGYEPGLAKDLATDKDDPRLDDFQKISETNSITIGAGIPTKSKDGLHISLILFQPGQLRQVYSKKYLHEDEDPFFVPGPNLGGLKINNINTALAICYELSIPEHSENAFKNGAQLYIASVAKTAGGVAGSEKTLADIARKYSCPVLMSNSVGPSDNFIGAGRSSAWNTQGHLVAQLDDKNEGILIYDMLTQQCIST